MFCNSSVICLLCAVVVAESCLISPHKSNETLPVMKLPQMLMMNLTDLKH